MKPIPPIKDGGYTKGHFYEFADGQVTMRDSITSDIYAVHSYIPEGLVGVITSHIMHKILGDISLESATLTDVILPRVRPRPFDAKKTTSFREKMFAIPSQYHDYYPGKAEAIQSGSEETSATQAENAVAQPVTTKRGRPVKDVINAEGNEVVPKKLGRKKATVNHEKIRTNSILKFFLPNVVTALAMPRKNHVKEESNLSIVSQDVLASSRTSESYEILASSCLGESPAELREMVVQIIEDEIFYGCKWGKCSCSFDTVITIMLYLFLNFSQTEREKFTANLREFGVAFERVNILSPTSLREMKDVLMPIFLVTFKSTFTLGYFYAVERVYQELAFMMTAEQENDDFRIHYLIKKHCGNEACSTYNVVKNLKHERTLDLFESPAGAADMPQDRDINELLGEYWTRRTESCKECSNNLIMNRVFGEASPKVLVVSIGTMDTVVNFTIAHMGHRYKVAAVAYIGESHFIARLMFRGLAYEYDGNAVDGRLRKLLVAAPFETIITDLSGRRMKAATIWYVKDIVDN
jgi:hypothetical protein